LIAVTVLAGGEGLRMGGEKPLRAYGSDTLLGHAVALARSWSSQVAVSVRDAAQVRGATDAPLIFDDPALGGPLAGVAAALDHARRIGADRALTVPCDTPHLPADLAERLEAGLGGSLVAMAASGGIIHPVCALWRPEAAERLAAYVATGRGSLRGFGEACGMATVDWPMEGGDPFANANTPQELQALQPPRP
jgi:molybdopterin-guanine dinucleotide biosynthesis protein A